MPCITYYLLIFQNNFDWTCRRTITKKCLKMSHWVAGCSSTFDFPLILPGFWGEVTRARYTGVWLPIFNNSLLLSHLSLLYLGSWNISLLYSASFSRVLDFETPYTLFPMQNCHQKRTSMQATCIAKKWALTIKLTIMLVFFLHKPHIILKL